MPLLRPTTDAAECFRILAELDKKPQAVKLRVATETGPQEFWCPIWCSRYRSMKQGKIRHEVWVPTTIAKKAGLIKS